MQALYIGDSSYKKQVCVSLAGLTALVLAQLLHHHHQRDKLLLHQLHGAAQEPQLRAVHGQGRLVRTCILTMYWGCVGLLVNVPRVTRAYARAQQRSM